MRFLTWLIGLGPPVVVVAVLAAGLVPPAVPVSEVAGHAARDCPRMSGLAAVARERRAARAGTTVASGVLLDERGAVAGQLVSVSGPDGLPRALTLAGESFAAAPVAGVVVYGEHLAGGPRLRALDVETGCEVDLPGVEGVARGALLAPDLESLYVHSVDEVSRADRGVARLDLDTGAAEQVIEPLEAAEPFGITFATLLRWSADGTELAVQSCGLRLCRTRVLDTRTGVVATYAEPFHGELVGLTSSTIFAFDACSSWPCAVVAIDRASGAVSEVEPEALAASFDEDAGGSLLSVETPAGTKEIRP